MAAEKIPAKRFGQSRNKTPQSTLTGDERARGLRSAGLSPRPPGPGRHSKVWRPKALVQAASALFDSSTHQELEHDVRKEGAMGGCNSVGRSQAASHRATGGARG